MTLAGSTSFRASSGGGASAAWSSSGTGAASEATLLSTVSRTRIDAYDATVRLVGARVLLDGIDVSAHLTGTVDITDGVDRPITTGSFALSGRQWLPHVTTRTWSRSTLVEIWHDQQPLGGESHEARVLAGVVDTCSPIDGGVRVSVADYGLAWADAQVCYELPPFSGKTRGQIAREILAQVGVDRVDVPDGAVYDGGIESGDRDIWQMLQDLGQPEGWRWRVRADGSVEAYTLAQRKAPELPDHTWHARDLLSAPQIEPPSDVPSTWIVRGDTVVIDEGEGEQTEVETVETWGIFAPAAAVSRVQPDGTVQPLGGVGPTPSEMLISRVTTATTRRGSLTLRQVVTEEGWRNLLAAVASTGGGTLGAGPGPAGTYPLSHFLDESGAAVVWASQRWGTIGRREVDSTYDDDGTLSEQLTRLYRLYSVREAIGPVSDWAEDGSQVASRGGVVLGADGASYRQIGADGAIETFGLAEEHMVVLDYGPLGAQTGETLERKGWITPKASVTPTSGFFRNADGTGMRDATSSWGLIERRVRKLGLDTDGRIRRETLQYYGYTRVASASGEHDFGDYKSALAVEPFLLRSTEHKAFTVLHDGAYRIDGTAADGTPLMEHHQGQPPTPSWRSSPWVQLVVEPLEIVLDDEVLQAWFGRSSETLSGEQIQSTREAITVLDQTLMVDLAYRIRVERPDTLGAPGETVLLIDPSQDLAHRCLILERTRSREGSRAAAVYSLAAPLPRAALEVEEVPLAA